MQGRRLENFAHAGAVVHHTEAFRHGADNLFLDAAVRVQRHGDRQVVIGAETAGDDFLVVALAADDASIHFTLFNQPLAEHRREHAENITRAEVQPLGLLAGVFGDLRGVELRQVIALPGFCIFERVQVQLHDGQTLPSVLSSISQQPSRYMMPSARS